MSARARILVIVGVRAKLHTLSCALADDYDLSFADSVEEGIALVRESPPDLILLDAAELTTGCIGLLQTLRDSHLGGGSLVVLVTAGDPSEVWPSGPEQGVDDFLTYPVVVPAARARLRNLLERRIFERARKTLDKDLARLGDRDFYRGVCRLLTEMLGTDLAFVGRLEAPSESVHVIDGWAQGRAMVPFMHLLAGTPCAEVLQHGALCHPDGVQALFPNARLLADTDVASYVGHPLLDNRARVLGILVTAGRKPLGYGLRGRALSLLELFVDRVASEILRSDAEQRLQQQLAFQQIAAETATALAIAGSDAKVDTAIDRCLLRLGGLFGADRAFIFQFSEDLVLMSNTHEWCAAGVTAQRGMLQDLPTDSTPWWKELLLNTGVVHVPRAADLPPHATAERAQLEAQSIQSLVILAMYGIHGTLTGFLGFDSVHRERVWSTEEHGMLQTMAGIIGAAIERRRTAMALERQSEYRTLIQQLSMSFVNLPLDRVDAAIQAALQRIGRFFDVGRVYVFDYDFSSATMSNTHEWCAPGVAPQIAKLQFLPLHDIEEFCALHRKGQPVLIEDVAGLPRGRLREILEPQQITSLITVPLMHDGECLGHVGIDVVGQRSHRLGEEQKDLLTLFAELLVNVLVRTRIERVLREKEHHFRTLANGVAALIWSSDTDGLRNFFNEPWLRFTGRKLEQEVGSGWLQGVHPEDFDNCRSAVDRILGSRTAFRIEYRLRRADGSYRWLLEEANPHHDSAGRFQGFIGFCYDIEERRQAEDQLLSTRADMAAIIENTLDSIWSINPGYEICYINEVFAQRFQQVFGVWLEPGSNILESLPESIRSMWKDRYDRALLGKRFSIVDSIDTRGAQMHLEASFNPIRRAGAVVGVAVFARDITRRREAEEKLKQAASVFEHANEGITITDSEGIILDVNAAFTRITGYLRDEVLGQNPRLLKSGRHDDTFYAGMWATLQSRGTWTGEVWNRRKNGEIFPESLTISAVRDPEGRVHRYVALFSDISTQKAHQRELEFIAHHDMLTGLPNRVLLADRLRQAMVQTVRRGERMAFVYLDLDGFKSINDTHGHDAGDQWLVRFAERLKGALREGDTLARLGGDEFALVLVNLPHDEHLRRLLRRILDTATEPAQRESGAHKVTASLGVSFFPQAEPIDADQLLRQADQAMYQAKIAGKNRYHLFDAARDLRLRGRHESLDRIRGGLERGEFLLHYQPKVDMRRGTVVGIEALVRWRHPERGLLSPSAFLPLLEGNPLMISLGDWVIEAALAQMAIWREGGVRLPVSVNVDGLQLHQPDFLEKLLATLDRHPELGPEDLELEVLESSALRDMMQISEIIHQCHGLGIHCSLDDFGAGYSSLNYLKRLPVRALKVDREFVHDMLDDPEDLAILQAVIGLARAFRCIVIAEGVETELHGEMLLQLGCDLGQGYAIARPMPAERIPEWLALWKPPDLWLETGLVPRDGLPVLSAIVDHRAWMRDLRGFLSDELPRSPDLDAGQCSLGRWLHGAQGPGEAAPSCSARAESLHARLHELAASLVDLKLAGNGNLALSRMGGVDALSAELLDELRQWIS